MTEIQTKDYDTLIAEGRVTAVRNKLTALAHEVGAHEGTEEFQKLLEDLTHHTAQLFGIVVPVRQPRRNRLTWPKVDAIREAYAKGEKDMQTLAEDYGVTYSTIHRIVTNRLWIR